MRIIEELFDAIQIRRYQDKARTCGVSTELLKGNHFKTMINIPELLDKSCNFSQLNENVREELMKREMTDFYDFSLLMGLNFGVYNCYNYVYLSEPIKNQLLEVEPSVYKTKMFFQNNYHSIYYYLEEQYGMDPDMYQDIVIKMFDVIPDHSFYNHDIVNEISQILFGCQLRFGTSFFESEPNSTSRYIRSGLAKEKFLQSNQIVKKRK